MGTETGDRPSALLSKKQRKFLKSNIKNTEEANQIRYRIRNRVKTGLEDFRLLGLHLNEEDRSQIFDVEQRSPQFAKLQKDVQAAISFMYAGMNGESGFRKPLLQGVAKGEMLLGNTETHFDVESRFAVDFVSHVDRRETVEAVENKEWDKVSHRSLYTFISLAHNAEAIDFDKLHNLLDRHEEAEEWLKELREESNESEE